jgi:hypothetical protein
MKEFWASVSWRLSELFLPERKPAPMWSLVARTILLGVVIAYGWRFHWLSMRELTDLNGSYALHSVHLVFHEAGHVLFSWCGEFMTVLGGSLLQVLMPFIWFLAARFKGHDAFAGALCLWLMGHSLVDVSPYINDARSLQMVLIGGVTGREVEGHDWEWILTRLDLLHRDVFISRRVLSAGRWIMALSLGWAAVVLIADFRVRRTLANREPLKIEN